MKTLHASVAIAAMLFCFMASPAVAAIRLLPVVTSGIANATFVGNAGDGSNRLFIEQQSGIISVLQPNSSTPTTFLDIHTKVVFGGEQGLVGLAFHPLYSVNGRFFVYYTRAGDGTLVLAEYKVSAADRNVADPTEKVLLTIPHPTNTNHNGGMLAFGPDGYLYIGVGDGGSGNDPPNNAQNINVLLGKILRIDINPTDTSLPYVSPSTNPFFGATPGRDEIFAFGVRNPWRFSFDRLTGQQWLGDVGQSAREEVDTPILNGGNYGWRVYEGFLCTNNDPTLCNPANYIPPIFDYAHSLGRCSITGGYVYRGSGGAVPSGTYIYGDYCSGEIFAWNGSAQSLLLDTTQNISSFGEDEQGELYVVNLGGTVSKIVSAAPCTYSISPTSQTFNASGGTNTVTVTAGDGCQWTAVSQAPSWITITGGASGSGNGTVTYSVAPYTGKPKKRNGTMTIAGMNFAVNQAR
jgi:glucose/arabinose dehydrogenase